MSDVPKVSSAPATEPSWSLSGQVLLVPWGTEIDDPDDHVSCAIEQLGGEVAYDADGPRDKAAYGRDKRDATIEYVRDGEPRRTELPPLRAREFADLKAQAHRELGEVLARHARIAYVPRAEPTTTSGKESRYFGRPWMPDGMAWPTSGGTPLDFVLQLDLSALPGPARGGAPGGLMLFFHGRKYGDDQSLVAVVAPAAPGGLRSAPEGVPENLPLAVAEWREVVDFPDLETMEKTPGFEPYLDVAIGYGSDTIGFVAGADGRDYGEREAVEAGIQTLGHCFECDKVGGWPAWAHDEALPCGSDGVPMEFLMQVGHEGLVLGAFDRDDIDWPTWGCGRVFLSRSTGEFRYVAEDD